MLNLATRGTFFFLVSYPAHVFCTCILGQRRGALARWARRAADQTGRGAAVATAAAAVVCCTMIIYMYISKYIHLYLYYFLYIYQNNKRIYIT